ACQQVVIIITGRQFAINTFCCLFGSTVSTLFTSTCQPVLPAIFLLLVDAHAVNRTDQAFPGTKTNCLTRINLGFFRAKWQAIAGIQRIQYFTVEVIFHDCGATDITDSTIYGALYLYWCTCGSPFDNRQS